MRECAPASPTGAPIRISFYGAACASAPNIAGCLIINVIVEDGDFLGMLEEVKTNGGIWGQSEDEEAIFHFLPWPCARVEIGPP
jgi:hypothetical protein